MNTSIAPFAPTDRVFVAAGKTRKRHEGRVFEVDKFIPETGKVCCTYREGHGEDLVQRSYLFDAGILSPFVAKPKAKPKAS